MVDWCLKTELHESKTWLLAIDNDRERPWWFRNRTGKRIGLHFSLGLFICFSSVLWEKTGPFSPFQQKFFHPTFVTTPVDFVNVRLTAHRCGNTHYRQRLSWNELEQSELSFRTIADQRYWLIDEWIVLSRAFRRLLRYGCYLSLWRHHCLLVSQGSCMEWDQDLPLCPWSLRCNAPHEALYQGSILAVVIYLANSLI